MASSQINWATRKWDDRERIVANQLRENGVTYNIYGDPAGMNRPWMLDPVPVVQAKKLADH
ncbi:MAG: hypothetical protein U5K79_15355 [Cyclobacteriaceae bacterium]|nr:hypothetical protein [Cyclobacteriaceae bacterium]